jgi:hypothetical protein
VQRVGQDALGGARKVVLNHSSSRDAALTSASPKGETLFGVRVPPEVKQGVLLATLTILGGMLLLALLLADEAGIGPRHPEWRARWRNRGLWH